MANNMRKINTPLKCTTPNTFNTARNLKRCQRRTTRECISTYFGNPCREG